MNGSARSKALAGLDALVGEWSMQAVFPGVETEVPVGNCVFEWVLDGSFLAQRTHIPVPEAPDSLAVVGPAPHGEGYLQHYYDSRGVVRLYAMSVDKGVWRLLREHADESPLDFRQRFTGLFGDDGDTINGTWEKAFDASDWEHDFALIYRRARST